MEVPTIDFPLESRWIRLSLLNNRPWPSSLAPIAQHLLVLNHMLIRIRTRYLGILLKDGSVRPNRLTDSRLGFIDLPFTAHSLVY